MNLFEHHHPHGEDEHAHGPHCAHGHAPDLDAGLDPAQRSLADALRVSFGVLKIVMAVLVVVYLLSGLFKVPQDQVALRLRFGRIVGEEGRQVIVPDGRLHWSWPYPVEQVLRVPGSKVIQQVSLDRAFYFNITDEMVGRSEDEMFLSRDGLDPLQDGSLLTADANLVHARWNVSFVIGDPVAYIRNVGDIAAARTLVLATVEQAIVYAAARTVSDEIVKGRSNTALAQEYAQKLLDTLQSGIRIETLAVPRAVFPLPVRQSSQAVNRAESDRATRLSAAQSEATQVLGRTIGRAYLPLWGLIQRIDLAEHAGDQALASQLNRELEQAFHELAVTDASGQKLVMGGEVAQIINDAAAYEQSARSQADARAAVFQGMLPNYQRSPGVLLNKLWEDARREILSGDVDTFYLPAGQPWIKINRDPDVAARRAEERMKAQNQGRR